MATKRRIALVVHLLFPAFVTAAFSLRANPNRLLQQRRAYVPIPIAVTIFPSFESSASDSSSSSSSSTSDMTTGSIGCSNPMEDTWLFQSPIWTAPLARLAAALGHVQKGASITQVRVVSCDASHLDLEAVVCEQEQCVSLHIPVDFVHPCYSQELNDQEYEACLMDNLEQLNNQQSLPVSTEQRESYTSRTASTVRTNGKDLNDHIQLPDWWVYSESVSLAKECDKLRELLNRDDFRNDLVDLWDRNNPKQQQEQSRQQQQSPWMINTVRVARIGLAGIVLQQQQPYPAATSGSSEITSGTADTPYLALPFHVLAPVSNANDLREAVLTMMEQE